MYLNIIWETVTEQNNAIFTIEKSKNGINFTKLIDLPGANNSNTYKNYSETDYQPYIGISYYRLKQTDYNNHYKYFNIVPVNIDAQQNIIIYPNPLTISNSLTIKVDGHQNQQVIVVLTDLHGLECFTKTIFSIDAEHFFIINETQHLPAGTYIITATSDNTIYNYKLIVR